MAYPVESLTNASSQEEIQRAVQETTAQLVQEGVPQDQAAGQAAQMAMQATQGGSTKLMQNRRVGPLQKPITDMGIGAMGGGNASLGGGGYQTR